jgi:signal transduction histidine kinase
MKTGKIIRKISLRRKIFQYLLWTNFISIILLGLIWIQGRVSDYRKEILNLKESFSENKKSEIRSNILQLKEWIYWIRNHPDDAFSTAATRHLLNYSGPNSTEKFLQQYCLDSLSRIRYSADEYVFVNTSDGNALISNGKINTPPVDIFSAGDTSWIRIFKTEQLAKTKPGGFFYNYSFRKISSSKFSMKTSYISYFPEWDWIIGTGYYEDDINPLIEHKREELIVSMRESLLKVAPLILITILFSMGIVLLFSRRMAKNVEVFKDFFSKAASDKISIDKSKVSYNEFDILAQTANRMVEESIKAEAELKLHRNHLEELVIQRTAELEVEKEHAQSADRLKSAFLATMSHELRTPLNSIIGFTGILMQELPGKLNDEQKKQLGMAQNSARHLLSLVNDVLDISKIEAGQFINLISLS